jgi:vancomycin permeability regulator SanA
MLTMLFTGFRKLLKTAPLVPVSVAQHTIILQQEYHIKSDLFTCSMAGVSQNIQNTRDRFQTVM